MTELSRFTFEVLRHDEHFILCRGRSKDGSSQILLRSPTRQDSTLQDLKRLEQAYSLKEELDPAWAVRPTELAWPWDCTVLSMEDPGGVPLDQLLGQPLDLAFSLRIAISLLSAIGHLHQRGIIQFVRVVKMGVKLATRGAGSISQRALFDHQ